MNKAWGSLPPHTLNTTTEAVYVLHRLSGTGDGEPSDVGSPRDSTTGYQFYFFVAIILLHDFLTRCSSRSKILVIQPLV